MRRSTKNIVRRAGLVYLVLFLVLSFPWGPHVLMAHSSLLVPDPAFGDGGEVQTKFKLGGSPFALAVKGDGDLIAVGEVFPDSLNSRIAGIVDYKSGGNLNSQFGQHGIVLNANMNYASAVVAQPNGQVIIGGQALTFGMPGGQAFALARYNADGSLDTSFGNGGQVFDSYARPSDGLVTIVLQPDGKILAVGDADMTPAGAAQPNGDFAIARYNPDGSLDTTFGASGKVLTDLDGGYDSITAVTVEPNGKILAAGFVGMAPASFGIGLAQYNPDGSLDSTFGNGGKSSTSLPGASEQIQRGCISVDSSGNIVVAGVLFFDDGNQAEPDLIRFNSAGALDASFGNGGRVDPSDIVGGLISALQIEPDGKIFVSGLALFPYSPSPTKVFSARYNFDGTPDPEYNAGAPSEAKFYGGFGQPYVGILQPNGEYVVAGYDRDRGFPNKFLLLRYRTGAQ